MRYFVDTNVLAYAEDASAGPKRQKAQDLVRRAFEERSGVLSLQVLRELYVVATRKLGIPAEHARRRIELYASLEVVAIALPDLLAAIDLTRLHSFSLWDALIVRAAVISGCEVLYSEDMQHGFRIERLRIENPFA